MNPHNTNNRSPIIRSICTYWSVDDGSFWQKLEWTYKWLYYRLRLKLGLNTDKIISSIVGDEW